MITVAVLGILSTVALSVYKKQVQKGRRVEAKSALTRLALAQERYHAMFGSYATTVNKLNFGPDGSNNKYNDTYAYTNALADLVDQDGVTGPDFYSFALTSDANGTSFTFTVTAKGAQLNDTDCRTFTINQLGEKTAESAVTGTDGSKVVTTQKCW
jgi:type IV pilus assembly protein PilE